VTFRPGDLHLMLMAPQASLTEAASVMLQLTFDDGSVIETPAAFRRAAPPAESGHGAHEQGSMGAGS
jgi:copper(I)-binding protein